jgi:hypothetical protein
VQNANDGNKYCGGENYEKDYQYSGMEQKVPQKIKRCHVYYILLVCGMLLGYQLQINNNKSEPPVFCECLIPFVLLIIGRTHNFRFWLIVLRLFFCFLLLSTHRFNQSSHTMEEFQKEIRIETLASLRPTPITKRLSKLIES